MTLLQIVQAFCLRTGLPKPLLVATSKDDQVVQYLGLLNEILDDLAERKVWSAMQIEATFVSLAAEDQGALSALAPQGFIRILDDTLYDRTENTTILGPVRASTWQASKAGFQSISDMQYRIKGGHLFLTPAPAAGNTIAFEYQGQYPVVDNSAAPATSGKAYCTLDTDTFLYPDKLLILGLRWLWKREKGLRYAEDFRGYESAVTNFASTDGGNPVIDLAGDAEAVAGISAPSMSWSL